MPTTPSPLLTQAMEDVQSITTHLASHLLWNNPTRVRRAKARELLSRAIEETKRTQCDSYLVNAYRYLSHFVGTAHKLGWDSTYTPIFMNTLLKIENDKIELRYLSGARLQAISDDLKRILADKEELIKTLKAQTASLQTLIRAVSTQVEEVKAKNQHLVEKNTLLTQSNTALKGQNSELQTMNMGINGILQALAAASDDPKIKVVAKQVAALNAPKPVSISNVPGTLFHQSPAAKVQASNPSSPHVAMPQ